MFGEQFVKTGGGGSPYGGMTPQGYGGGCTGDGLWQSGTQIAPYSYSYTLTEAGTFHSLRHYFATALIVAGADPTDVQKALRHSTVARRNADGTSTQT